MRHAAAFGALYGALALALFALNGDHAYHPTDDGFILAYAWRVAGGEVPYRDFIYERTPLSPYLHAVWLALPEGWQIQAGRLAFYVELGLTGLFPTLWLVARRGVRATARPLALAAIAYLFAVHNFPPMPWPTVDALVLASAASSAFLFSLEGERRLAFRVAASLLAALAVLAKQTFAPLAALLAAFALAEALASRSWRPLAASVLPAVAVLAAALSALAAQGALLAFAQQILAPLQLRPTAAAPWSGDLWSTGIATYLRSLEPLVAVFTLPAFALVWWRDRDGPGATLARKAGTLGLFAAFAAFATELQVDVLDAGRHVFWLLSAALAAHALRWWRREREDPLTLAAYASALAAAWCASLSFAYQTPLLGLAAAGPLLERSFPSARWPGERPAIALAAAVVVASVLLLDLEQPYRDVPRAAQIADLGSVYPRFGHLYTNRANVERFRELRELSARYARADGRAFVVLPDYPLIYFLADERNPLSLDWFQAQEYLGNKTRLSRELAERRPLVLIERESIFTADVAPEPPARCDVPAADASDLVSEVMTRWSLVSEGRYFCVYRSPN